MKAIFSTGEAAEICQVSQQTIIRCFDNGRLKGFRVPGSRFRRIPRASLIQFMKEHDIPMDAIDSGKHKILVVGGDSVAALADTLKRDAKCELRLARSGYEAGMITQEFMPDLIFLGTMESPAEQLAICRSIKANPDMQHIRIVAAGKLSAGQAEQLAKSGADAILEPSTSSDKIVLKLHAVMMSATEEK